MTPALPSLLYTQAARVVTVGGAARTSTAAGGGGAQRSTFRTTTQQAPSFDVKTRWVSDVLNLMASRRGAKLPLLGSVACALSLHVCEVFVSRVSSYAPVD
jgi:hypothetical protein